MARSRSLVLGGIVLSVAWIGLYWWYALVGFGELHRCIPSKELECVTLTTHSAWLDNFVWALDLYGFLVYGLGPPVALLLVATLVAHGTRWRSLWRHTD